MKLPNSKPLQVNVRIDAIEYILQRELHVFKSSGEQTYNSNNGYISPITFAWNRHRTDRTLIS